MTKTKTKTTRTNLGENRCNSSLEMSVKSYTLSRKAHGTPWMSRVGGMSLIVLLLSILTPTQAIAEAEAPAIDTVAMRQQAIALGLEGKFDESLKLLTKTDPDDTATRLMRRYVADRDKTLAEQAAEYAYEVKRIQWAKLAQAHVSKLNAKPYAKALRKLIRKSVTDAYGEIALARNFEESTTKEATAMKATSLKHITKAREAMAKAVALFAEEKEWPLAVEFRREAKRLDEELAQAAAIWTAVDPSSRTSRWDGARKVGAYENTLAESLTDIGVLTSKKPWRVGLMHGRLAKEIAPDPQGARHALWYLELIRDAERHGEEAEANAKWYDALSAYVALEEMEKGNEEYELALARVRRHVRVLGLYGGKDALSDPDEDDDEAMDDDEKPETEDFDENLWKQMTRGIDAKMVRRAISRLGESYVSAVDYRKLAEGGLNAVKVLVETPQAGVTFSSLKDDAKRTAFLKVINAELDDLKKKDRIDKIRLHITLNRIVDANENTIDLPLGVIVMEFADGFMKELDRFSTMIWPNDVRQFERDTMGHFEGIGVHIKKLRGKPLRVVSPLLGTPAYKAGLKAGDEILSVNGKPTKDRSVSKLVKQIMGRPGTTVTLTIRRRGLEKPFDVKVPRGNVRVRTVKGWRRGESGEWTYLIDPQANVGYIRMTQFTKDSHKHMKEALTSLSEKGCKSVVLDLRGNPGGLLHSTAAIANEFMDGEQKGKRIVSTKGRQMASRVLKADATGVYLPEKGDVVVLIDGRSASASEILSGALHDTNRAIIVGERSYGKGSVQNMIPVSTGALGKHNALLKLTTAYYYLPSGRLLHRRPKDVDWGVNPDVKVQSPPRKLRRWLTLRHKTDLLQDFDPKLLSEDLKSQFNEDLPLRTAVLLLELRRLQRGEEISDLIATGEAEAISTP
jgi:carboxyl-terminal processing protease